MKQKTILAVLSACIVISAIAFSSAVNASRDDDGDAGGDKVKNPWQTVPEDQCVVFSPEGLSDENCEVDPDGVSGQDYLCTFDTHCPDSIDDNN